MITIIMLDTLPPCLGQCMVLEESHLYSYEPLNKLVLQYSQLKVNNLAVLNLIKLLKLLE